MSRPIAWPRPKWIAASLCLAALFNQGPLSAAAAPATAVSPEAPAHGPGLSAQDLRDLDQAWQNLLGNTDPYNGLSLYIAQQNGTALVDGIFTLGDAAMQARLLQRTSAFLQGVPTFSDLRRQSASTRVIFDRLTLPTDARLANRHLFPTRQDGTLNVQTANGQQFGYLLSTIVRLASRSRPPVGGEASWNRDLQHVHDFVMDDIIRLYWLETPAWHWAGPFANMRARTMARLDGDARLRSRRFFRAFTDYDLHVLAMAADLQAAHRASPGLIRSQADTALIGDVVGIAFRVLRERVDREGEGFAFDRGMWDDNPLADYAGCQSTSAPVRPCRGTNLTQDVSHAQRWPLWLQSFHEAAQGSAEQALVQQWRVALARQMGSHVIRFDDRRRPLFANYLDGRDGWYNYSGATGAESGNRPSSMTGWSMRHGAWSLLAPLDARLAEASRQFCRVILSTDPADVTFRTRNYGAPGPDPQTGFASVTDEFGARSRYIWPCRIYTAIGLI